MPLHNGQKENAQSSSLPESAFSVRSAAHTVLKKFLSLMNICCDRMALSVTPTGVAVTLRRRQQGLPCCRVRIKVVMAKIVKIVGRLNKNSNATIINHGHEQRAQLLPPLHTFKLLSSKKPSERKNSGVTHSPPRPVIRFFDSDGAPQGTNKLD